MEVEYDYQDEKWLESGELNIKTNLISEDTLRESINQALEEHNRKNITMPIDLFNGILLKKKGRRAEVNQSLRDAIILYMVLLAHQKKIQKREDNTFKCHIRYLMGFLQWGQKRVTDAIKLLENRNLIEYEYIEDPRRPNIKLLS